MKTLLRLFLAVFLVFPSIVHGQDTDPILYYSFDDATSNAVKDNSSNGSDGKIIDDPKYVNEQPCSAKSGYSFDFGGGDYLDVQNPDPLFFSSATSFTYSFWVNPHTIKPMTILAQGHNNSSSNADFSFEIGGGGEFIIHWEEIAYQKIAPAGTFKANKWYHVAVVYTVGTDDSQNTFELFLDGQFKGKKQGVTFGKKATNLFIGRHYKNGLGEYQGLIDEFKIFNYSLDESDVRDLYDSHSLPIINQPIADQSVCMGSTVNLSVDSPNAQTYQWLKDGDPLSGETGKNLIFSNVGVGDAGGYSVEVKNACGVTPSNMAKLTVSELLEPKATVVSDKSSYCKNETAHFTLDTVNLGNAPVFDWFFNSNSVGEYSAEYSNSSMSDGDYVYVKVRSSLQCVSPKDIITESFIIKVKTPVKPTVKIQQDKSAICEGETVNFTISDTTNLGATPTFRWILNGKSAVGDELGTGSSLAYNQFNDGDKVKLEVTSSLACVSTNVVESDELKVNSAQAPDMTLGGGGHVCWMGTNHNVTITATKDRGYFKDWHSPSNSAGVFADVTSANTDYTVDAVDSANGEVVLVALAENGVCQERDTLHVTISNAPTPALTIEPLNPTTCNGSPVTFSIASKENEGGYPTYQWFVDNIAEAGATGEIFSTSTLQDGQVVKCEMNVKEACVMFNDAYSNEVAVSVIQGYNETASEEICDGDSYTFGSQNLTTSGTYSHTFQSQAGCDSVVTLQLTVLPKNTESISATIKEGETYQLGTQTLGQTGSYSEIFQSAKGCDSTVTLDLTVLDTKYSQVDASICDGESYTFDGNDYSTAGSYTGTWMASDGADSVVTLNLTVNPTYSETLYETICEFDSYTFGGQNLTAEGTYTENLQTVNGCDSTVTLYLTVLPNYNGHELATINEGETYIFGSQTLTTSGSYTETFTAVNGCDSTVALDLAVLQAKDGETYASICEGEKYDFNGTEYDVSGSYSQTLQAHDGTDSIVTLHLTVNDVPVVTVNGKTTFCPNETLTWTASGADGYVWKDPSNTVIGNGFTVDVSPSGGPQVYSVEGTTQEGCSATQSININPVTSTPTNYNLTLQETEVCEGTEGVLEIASSEYWVEYQLLVDNSPVGGTQTGTGSKMTFSIPESALSAGPNTIELEAKDTQCPAKKMPQSNTLHYHLQPSITLTVEKEKDSLCVGEATGLLVKGAQQNVEYWVEVGNQSVSQRFTGQNADLSIPLDASKLTDGVNQLTVKAESGVCGEVTLNADPQVFQRKDPDLTKQILVSDICGNEDGQIELVASETKMGYAFYVNSQQVGPIVIGNNSNLIVPVPASNFSQGANSVTVKVKEGVLCSFKDLNATETIQVSPSPSANPVTANDGTVICGGQAISLEAVSGMDAYKWLKDGQASSLPNNQMVSVPQGGDYQVVVNKAGCSDTSDVITVSDVGGSGITIQSSGNDLCQGSVNLSVPSSSGATYQWYFGADTSVIAGADEASVQAFYPGKYGVEVSTPQGCKLRASYDVSPMAGVQVPVIQFANQILSSSVLGSAYQWFVELDGKRWPIVGATSQSYQPYYNGIYSVNVLQQSCDVLSKSFTVNVSSWQVLQKNAVSFTSEGVEIGLEPVLYPNPTTGRFYVDFQGTGNPVVLRLYDAQGIQRQVVKASTQFGRNTVFLESEGLTSGIYLLRIEQENGSNEVVSVVVK